CVLTTTFESLKRIPLRSASSAAAICSFDGRPRPLVPIPMEAAYSLRVILTCSMTYSSVDSGKAVADKVGVGFDPVAFLTALRENSILTLHDDVVAHRGSPNTISEGIGNQVERVGCICVVVGQNTDCQRVPLCHYLLLSVGYVFIIHERGRACNPAPLGDGHSARRERQDGLVGQTTALTDLVVVLSRPRANLGGVGLDGDGLAVRVLDGVGLDVRQAANVHHPALAKAVGLVEVANGVVARPPALVERDARPGPHVLGGGLDEASGQDGGNDVGLGLRHDGAFRLSVGPFPLTDISMDHEWVLCQAVLAKLVSGRSHRKWLDTMTSS